MNENGNSSEMKISSIVVSVVFLSWFALSMLGMVMAGKAQQTGWAVILFGQYFVVFGLIWLFKEIKAGGIRQPIFLLLPIVGFLTVTGGLLWQFGDDVMKEKVVASIPNVAAGLFLAVGIVILAGAIALLINSNSYRSSCREEKAAFATLIGAMLFIGICFVAVSVIAIYAYNFL